MLVVGYHGKYVEFGAHKLNIDLECVVTHFGSHPKAV